MSDENLGDDDVVTADTHLSDYRLDQLLAGELAPGDVALSRSHLESCDSCAARHATLVAEKSRFEARDIDGELATLTSAGQASPARPTGATVHRPRSWQRRAIGPAMLVMSLAACAFLLVQVVNTDRPPEIRTKGKPTINYVVGTGEVIEEPKFAARRGGVVYPGDRVQWFVTSPGPVDLAILSRDGAGVVSTYFPASGSGSGKVEGRGTRAVPLSTELDATLGREDVYAIFCRGSFQLGELTEQLKTAGRAPEPIAGCTVSSLMLVKQDRP